jgi:hypothetical protein
MIAFPMKMEKYEILNILQRWEMATVIRSIIPQFQMLWTHVKESQN